METPIGDDEDSHLGDFLEDTETEAPAEAAQNENLEEAIKQVLDSLTPREAKVLRSVLVSRCRVTTRSKKLESSSM